jgi:hypothetical protein
MRFARALGMTLLLAFAPAAAHAATIRTDVGTVFYAATGADQISMGVDIGLDPELGANAIFFRPIANTPPHTPPGTTDVNCRASVTARCASRAAIDIQGGDRDDFVRVLQGGGTVTFRGGNGNDHAVSDSSSVQLSLHGQAGNDWMQGNPDRAAVDIVDGGPGNDLLDPGLNDAVGGGPDVDTVRMPFPGGEVVTLDNVANDGRPGEHFNINSSVENVIGGPGGDQIDGSSGPNMLDGAGGNDTLNGLAGADTLIARDGAADSLSCGPGDDRAIVDPLDTVSPDCEVVEYVDADQDGSDAHVDCNDANAAIHPGAVDVAGNGVDEDCSGADATPPVLGGTTPPTIQQSPPTQPARTSNPEQVVVTLAFFATAKRTTTKFTTLQIKNVPFGATVKVTCSGRGCPSGLKGKGFTKANAFGTVTLAKFIKKPLRAGVRITVAVSKPNAIAAVKVLTVRASKKPLIATKCQPPGATKPVAC